MSPMMGPATQGPQQLDGPPPSPVVSPAAASESSKMQMLTGGAAPGQPGGPTGPGARPSGAPDLSGIMMLGQKVDEALMSLAQALPAQAGIFGQASELLKNAIAQALQSQPGGGGPVGGAGGPAGGSPAGATTQAGNQFPGGGFGAGRTA